MAQQPHNGRLAASRGKMPTLEALRLTLRIAADG
jgi:hypothetical protein